MPFKAEFTGYADAAYNHGTTLNEAVGVISETYPEHIFSLMACAACAAAAA
jgi:hypothetical protein